MAIYTGTIYDKQCSSGTSEQSSGGERNYGRSRMQMPGWHHECASVETRFCFSRYFRANTCSSAVQWASHWSNVLNKRLWSKTFGNSIDAGCSWSDAAQGLIDRCARVTSQIDSWAVADVRAGWLQTIERVSRRVFARVNRHWWKVVGISGAKTNS